MRIWIFFFSYSVFFTSLKSTINSSRISPCRRRSCSNRAIWMFNDQNRSRSRRLVFVSLLCPISASVLSTVIHWIIPVPIDSLVRTKPCDQRRIRAINVEDFSPHFLHQFDMSKSEELRKTDRGRRRTVRISRRSSSAMLSCRTKSIESKSWIEASRLGLRDSDSTESFFRSIVDDRFVLRSRIFWYADDAMLERDDEEPDFFELLFERSGRENRCDDAECSSGEKDGDVGTQAKSNSPSHLTWLTFRQRQHWRTVFDQIFLPQWSQNAPNGMVSSTNAWLEVLNRRKMKLTKREGWEGFTSGSLFRQMNIPTVRRQENSDLNWRNLVVTLNSLSDDSRWCVWYSTWRIRVPNLRRNRDAFVTLGRSLYSDRIALKNVLDDPSWRITFADSLSTNSPNENSTLSPFHVRSSCECETWFATTMSWPKTPVVEERWCSSGRDSLT